MHAAAVLLEAKPSAKPQPRALYRHVLNEYVSIILFVATLETACDWSTHKQLTGRYKKSTVVFTFERLRNIREMLLEFLATFEELLAQTNTF